MDGRLRPDAKKNFAPEFARDNPALDRVVFGPEIHDFFRDLLGGDVRHFDYKWFRAIGPGDGTPPHCDIVYMGRGTFDLYTAWIPYGEVDLELGGVMILERSHELKGRLKSYLERDVDTYCLNKPGHHGWQGGGSLSKNPVTLRRRFARRWLTAEYWPGDVLIFGMATVHASLDNRSEDRLRLSSDTRYQLASEPVDERWIGENPIGHSEAGKRGRIC